MKNTDSLPIDEQEKVRGQVREGYAKIARETSTKGCGGGVSCCGPATKDTVKLARELGYSAEELSTLPAEVLKTVEALVGCVAGAVLAGDTERMAREAGLTDIVLKSKAEQVEAMTDWEDPLYRKIVEHLPKGAKPSDYVTSLEITATKPLSAVDYSPGVNELVALGAAIAANCEPCLKYHYRKAQQLGVSQADMARAVETGANVKDAPHQAILRLADRLTGSVLSVPADASDPCCGGSRPRPALLVSHSPLWGCSFLVPRAGLTGARNRHVPNFQTRSERLAEERLHPTGCSSTTPSIALNMNRRGR